MTKAQIDRDAQTVAAYITLESIANELEDCRDGETDGHSEVNDTIAVLERACEILEGIL